MRMLPIINNKNVKISKYFNVLDIDRATLEADQVASDIGEGTLEASTRRREAWQEI